MKKIKKAGKRLYTTLMALILTTVIPTIAFADDVANSKVVTGTKKLITDATGALAGLLLVSTILVVLYCFIRKGAADEMDQKKWHTRILIAVVCGVCGILSSAMVSMIFSYYQ